MPQTFQLGKRMLHEAFAQGLTLSQLLEREDPTSSYPVHERGMDAYQRQLARLDIRTQSDMTLGAPAHNFGRFWETDELGSGEERMVLASEFLNRTYRRACAMQVRRVAHGGFDKSGRVTEVTGGIRLPYDPPTTFDLYPPDIESALRYSVPAPSMLSYLVAITRIINGEASYALYLTDNVQAQADARMARVQEYAEIPAMRVATSETPTRVAKYGRRVDMSYEIMRRISMDLISFYIELIAAVASREKEDQAVDVLINGDGNASTAATSVNGSTYDAAAAGALTLKMYLTWLLSAFTRPYAANVLVGRPAAIVAAALLNAGSANIMAVTQVASIWPNALNFTIPRATINGLVFIDNNTVAANTLLGIDSRYALEMLIEAGSEIAETERVMSQQYTSIIISENVGFDIMIKQKVGAANQTLAQILAYTA